MLPIRTWNRMVIAALLPLVAVACTPPASAPGDSTPPAGESQTAMPVAASNQVYEAPTPAPRPAPAPAPYPKERTGPFLLNTSFEALTNGVPNHWNVSTPEVLAERSAEPSDGGHALALQGIADQWGFVNQPVNMTAGDLGKALQVTAAAIAPHPGQLSIEIKYNQNGKATVERHVFDASDDWTDGTVTATIPRNVDAKSVAVRIGLRPGAQHKYHVDNVRISLKQ